MNRSHLFARAKYLRLISIKLVKEILAGNYRSVFKGPGIEFDHAREYVENDDARLIDWNVSSRLSSAYTKTFREEREISLFLIVDMSASISDDIGSHGRRDVETLLFSLFTLAAINNDDKVGAIFFTDRIEKWAPAQKGRRHALRLLHDMLSLHPEGMGSDLALALRTVAKAYHRRGICVILSDFKTHRYRRELIQLARRHDVIALRIVDPIDSNFPSTGLIQLSDPETGEILHAMGRSRGFRRRYSETNRRERSEFRRDCARIGVSVLEISTEDEPAERVIQFFRKRRR